MLESVIIALVVAVVVIAIVYILSVWIYKRAPANMGFVRTGMLGTKVCLGRGAIVLPVFHEVTWVSLETIKLIVSRAREQAVLTSDKIRIDVVAELYAHVGRTPEDLLTASRSLGEKTFDPDKVRNLLEAKVVSVLRSYAATKTLSELHENREAISREMKAAVMESFQANGLTLEEVTIAALEQTAKEHFKPDNVFDAEGLKIITDITSDARRKVHETEKRTAVAIRQRDLDTQLDLLEIEKNEALAKAGQDKTISNEQAQQLREKQIFILDQRKAVEEREIENDVTLERMRTDREVAITEEAQKREVTEIQKELALEQERKDREIQLINKEREREAAEIQQRTAVLAEQEVARVLRHQASEDATVATRKQSVEARLTVLDLEKQEELAAAGQERDVANEKARALSERQRYILEQRWEVQQDEIDKALALDRAQIQKDAAVAEESKILEAAEVRRALALELEERDREIALIRKEQEREKIDIQRFLGREREERDREIALVRKTGELEAVEVERLKTTAEKENAEHGVESVRILADAERDKAIERIEAEKLAEVRRIDEENKAQISRMHMITQAEARQTSAEREAEATLIKARANSDAQKVAAEGIEKEAAAPGRAEMAVESLRVENTQRMLEAEATGIEAKADALKKYNEAATFLELAKMYIEAERDVHIDQAKAMGTALGGAQIRMYGGGDGTVETIRGMFTSGFGLGEALEGLGQSMPEGLRERLSAQGLRGLLGLAPGEAKPDVERTLQKTVQRLDALAAKSLRGQKARAMPLSEALAKLEQQASGDDEAIRAVNTLKGMNPEGAFDDLPFDKVWALLQSVAQAPSQA